MFVKEIGGIKLYQGDGLTKALSICKCISGESRSLFFVDGDHGYESVRRELMGIMKDVPAADILLHDTFNQSVESEYNIGPYKAIIDTLASIPDKYLMITAGLGLPGMTLLYQLRR